MGRNFTVGGGGHWWSQSGLVCRCLDATVEVQFEKLQVGKRSGIPLTFWPGLQGAGWLDYPQVRRLWFGSGLVSFWVWRLNDGQGPCTQQGLGARMCSSTQVSRYLVCGC